MQFISSDTSVWLDFSFIGFLYAPFLLKDLFTYVMSGDTIEAELLSPQTLKNDLLHLGLQRIEMDEEEYQLVLSYQNQFPQLSQFDLFALAIAKKRKYVLLTGDGRLRKAASVENIEVHGTLWVVDQLREYNRVDGTVYRDMLEGLKKHCGGKVRLPIHEIEKRLDSLKDSDF